MYHFCAAPSVMSVSQSCACGASRGVWHTSVSSCDGGANKLVDGFAVAEQVRARHPEAFELLTQVQMEYKDYHREVLWDSGPGGDAHSDGTAFGGRPNDTPRLGTRREVDFFLRYRHPVISLYEQTEWQSSRVCRINYSDHHRDSRHCHARHARLPRRDHHPCAVCVHCSRAHRLAGA